MVFRLTGTNKDQGAMVDGLACAPSGDMAIMDKTALVAIPGAGKQHTSECGSIHTTQAKAGAIRPTESP